MQAVITDAQYRMALPLIRDLGEHGVGVTVCYPGADLPYSARSKYVSGAVSLPGQDDPGRYIQRLFEVCAGLASDREKPVLLPVGAGTLELLADPGVRERFDTVCHALLPSRGALDGANDKASLAVLARSLEVPLPRIYSGGEEVSFPAVIKPVCGEKQGLHAEERYVIAHSTEELTSAWDRFRALGSEIIIEEYLPGEGLGLSVLARDGEIIDHIAHRRVRELPVSGGPSTCCEVIDGAELLPMAQKLIGALSFSGVAMVEFKRGADGVARLLEINPRIWGSFPLVRASGSALALNWFRVSAGLRPERRQPKPGARMYFLPSEAARGLKCLAMGRPGGLFAPLGDMLSPRCREGIFDLRDMAASWGYIGSYLKRSGK